MSTIIRSTAALLLAACMPLGASAAGLDLSRYSLTQTLALPASTASESSAITWNWDNDHLYVVGDEGEYITEMTRAGAVVSSMRLSGFDDTEGLTYIGNGQFVVAEERLQDVYRLNYQAGGSASRSSLASVSLGASVGNIGLEGLSYDRASGQFVTVKEKAPQAVGLGGIDFSNGTHTVGSLFAPSLGVDDLSDVQTLSGFVGTSFAGNLLIISQESRRLLEVTRTGGIVSQFDFSAISDTAEGVTIASDGTIYLTDETPNIYVLTATPVPEPEALALMLAGLGIVGLAARRRT